MNSDELELTMIRRAAAQDVTALQWFLLRYRRLLLHYVSRHLPAHVRSSIDPQDVVQDVYFAAFSHQATFQARDVRSARRWLVTMARNRIIDLARRRQPGRHNNPLTPSEDSVAQLLQELAVYERTPSQSAVAHELLGLLQRAIEQLPDAHRQAIRLRYIEGLSVEAVAQRLNKTPGAVHMLCNRGLKGLRLQLLSASSQYAQATGQKSEGS